ncbi:MAG: hypothetical protein GX660_04280 [Clostridiaceae bacterium]|nr:hypothetical protein [Clostridiaceae bacterium]
MAKYYGVIGFAEKTEVKPGVWKENIIEKPYFGDFIRNTRKIQSANQVNDNINISNQISIIADTFVNGNFHSMRYAEYMGTKWKITDIEVQHPRLLLTLGGIYNG